MNIYRRIEGDVWQYTTADAPAWIGTTKTTFQSFFQCMAVQSNQGNSLCLRKENFFLQFLAAIPLIGWFVLVPFHIYENGIYVGRSRKEFSSSVYTFAIKNDVYELSLHRRDKVSLLKNGKQIALYQRLIKAYIEEKPAYSVQYTPNVEKEILLLFCIFIDKIHFCTYDDYQWKIVIPFGDKHPERGDWKPPENEKVEGEKHVD